MFSNDELDEAMEVTKEEFNQTDQNNLEIMHGKEFDKTMQFESIDKEKTSVLRFGEIVEALMRKYVEKAHGFTIVSAVAEGN